MEEIRIVNSDAGNISGYAICGYKNPKQEGYRRKMEWLKKRYAEGLRFKILYSDESGTIGSIEYVPGEHTWRAVRAAGYMVIHCIFIVPRRLKGKGYGSLMVEECLREAKKEKMHGVAVVTRKGSWMAGKEIFLKKGFEPAGKAPPDFELLVKRFKKSAPPAEFPDDWDERADGYGKGLTFISSDQCPYVAKSMPEILETVKDYDIKPKVIEVKDSKEAQNAPSAYGGVFNMIYGGKLLAEHPISNTRFKNIMNKVM